MNTADLCLTEILSRVSHPLFDRNLENDIIKFAYPYVQVDLPRFQQELQELIGGTDDEELPTEQPALVRQSAVEPCVSLAHAVLKTNGPVIIKTSETRIMLKKGEYTTQEILNRIGAWPAMLLGGEATVSQVQANVFQIN